MCLGSRCFASRLVNGHMCSVTNLTVQGCSSSLHLWYQVLNLETRTSVPYWFFDACADFKPCALPKLMLVGNVLKTVAEFYVVFHSDLQLIWVMHKHKVDEGCHRATGLAQCHCICNNFYHAADDLSLCPTTNPLSQFSPTVLSCIVNMYLAWQVSYPFQWMLCNLLHVNDGHQLAPTRAFLTNQAVPVRSASPTDCRLVAE